MRLWRISEHRSLDGTGGLIVAGRWHRKGRPVVYLAESSALAMLEVLVHLEVATIPPSFQLIEVDLPDDLAVITWPPLADANDAQITADWGDDFLQSFAAPLARVPSVIAPGGANWLLNPLHPDAARAAISRIARWPWDQRLMRR